MGAGAGSTVIDGGQLDRVIDVCPAGSCPTSTEVAISGVSVRNGLLPPFGGTGAGLRSSGTLLLEHCSVRQNTIQDDAGGGIYNDGTLTLIGSEVIDNVAFAAGGIFTTDLLGAGDVTLVDSAVAGNSVVAGSGGIGTKPNTVLTLIRSTVSGNQADNFGGGIRMQGELLMVNSTVSGNRAGEDFGGIRVEEDALLTIANSTIADNVVTQGLNKCHGVCVDFGDGLIRFKNTIVRTTTAPTTTTARSNRWATTSRAATPAISCSRATSRTRTRCWARLPTTADPPKPTRWPTRARPSIGEIRPDVRMRSVPR